MLDRRVRLLQWLIRLRGRQFRPDASVGAVRAGYRELSIRCGPRPVHDVATTPVAIPVRDGSRLTGHLHRPANQSATLPVLLYFHGGGWVIGDVPSYDKLTRYLAHRGKVAVLSADYRKGPEHRYPTAFEDALDSYDWLVQNAASLGLDPERIAVGGDSAGGALAAAISAFAALRPAFQMLIYPPLDGTQRYPSRHNFRRGDMIVPEMRTWFARHALSDPSDLHKPYLVLLDAPHPERTPPTYFLAARYDALVDEGCAYVERLRAAGVAVQYDIRETLPHGMANLAGLIPEARRALDDAIGAVSRALR
jgi:acetyl esterase